MFNNIFTFFDRLRYTTQKRAIRVQFSNSQLNAQVMLQRIDGYHAINAGLSFALSRWNACKKLKI
ncbi:hypothetical protein [Acinetobacter nematophilus]|uniref:Uncharacterized protein n=1 Tax=Acinetobacter nematophilus TaxID=2994642 RepID=A0A9X3IGC9_9GAMM|nr:hypothetical protein [Acinetobacter nematophilus]MCX5467001.1 hypothetical protein [Acinetobacter nematophilus]